MSWLSAIPVIGTALDIGTTLIGLGKQKKAEKKADQEQARQQELWDKYQKPFAEENLRRLGEERPIVDALTNAQKSMLAGKAEDLPWWLATPATSGPEWDKLADSVTGIANLKVEEAAKAESSKYADLMRARGINISNEQASMLPGMNRWLTTEKFRAKSDAAQVLDEIAAGRRQEAEGKFYRVGQYARETPNPSTASSTGIDMAGQNAARETAKADAYGRQARDSLGGVMSYWGSKEGESERQQWWSDMASKFGGTSSAGATPGKSGNIAGSYRGIYDYKVGGNMPDWEAIRKKVLK
jgi:hypothetical protein